MVQAADGEGSTLLTLVLTPCRFSNTPLSVYQTVNNPQQPLAKLEEPERDEVYIELVDRIVELMHDE